MKVRQFFADALIGGVLVVFPIYLAGPIYILSRSDQVQVAPGSGSKELLAAMTKAEP